MESQTEYSSYPIIRDALDNHEDITHIVRLNWNGIETSCYVTIIDGNLSMMFEVCNPSPFIAYIQNWRYIHFRESSDIIDVVTRILHGDHLKRFLDANEDQLDKLIMSEHHSLYREDGKFIYINSLDEDYGRCNEIIYRDTEIVVTDKLSVPQSIYNMFQEMIHDYTYNYDISISIN